MGGLRRYDTIYSITYTNSDKTHSKYISLHQIIKNTKYSTEISYSAWFSTHWFIYLYVTERNCIAQSHKWI